MRFHCIWFQIVTIHIRFTLYLGYLKTTHIPLCYVRPTQSCTRMSRAGLGEA